MHLFEKSLRLWSSMDPTLWLAICFWARKLCYFHFLKFAGWRKMRRKQDWSRSGRIRTLPHSSTTIKISGKSSHVLKSKLGFSQCFPANFSLFKTVFRSLGLRPNSWKLTKQPRLPVSLNMPIPWGKKARYLSLCKHSLDFIVFFFVQQSECLQDVGQASCHWTGRQRACSSEIPNSLLLWTFSGNDLVPLVRIRMLKSDLSLSEIVLWISFEGLK